MLLPTCAQHKGNKTHLNKTHLNNTHLNKTHLLATMCEHTTFSSTCVIAHLVPDDARARTHTPRKLLQTHTHTHTHIAHTHTHAVTHTHTHTHTHAHTHTHTSWTDQCRISLRPTHIEHGDTSGPFSALRCARAHGTTIWRS